MKGSRSSNTTQNKQMVNSHIPKPENKDDLDSRSNEEQETKGDDTTHNKKDVRNSKKKVK